LTKIIAFARDRSSKEGVYMIKILFVAFLLLVLGGVSATAYAQVVVDTGKYAYIKLPESKYNCYSSRNKDTENGSALSALISEWLNKKNHPMFYMNAIPHTSAVCSYGSSGTATSITVGVHIFYHASR